MKICLDAGHGGKDPGAMGKNSNEKDINLKLALKLQDQLANCGIDIVMTRTSDVYLDLQQRCDIANTNKCDYFISIHCNSFSDSLVSGTETYYYPGTKKGLDLATAIQNTAIAYNKNKNRGVKTAYFYVLTYTDMPAVLIETAFISNEQEENMLNNIDWQNGFIKVFATAICNCLGIKYVESPKPEVPAPADNQPAEPGNYPIADLRHATEAQMESFVHKVNPSAPNLAALYLRIGMEEGIRGDIAFAQAIKETNYFKFTGTVKPEQNNFAGLGSTGIGIRGASFATVEDGVRAHIQHLKAYANTEPLRTKLIDPRFNFVKRGVAPEWEGLNGRWAVPGTTYGQDIIAIWKRILSEPI